MFAYTQLSEDSKCEYPYPVEFCSTGSESGLVLGCEFVVRPLLLQSSPVTTICVGPFLLPNNIKEGDYIELGQLGAYGLTFRTMFNGFYSNEIFELNDKPIMSLYEDSSDVDYLVA